MKKNQIINHGIFEYSLIHSMTVVYHAPFSKKSFSREWSVDENCQLTLEKIEKLDNDHTYDQKNIKSIHTFDFKNLGALLLLQKQFLFWIAAN